jgi:hypothetical protein
MLRGELFRLLCELLLPFSLLDVDLGGGGLASKLRLLVLIEGGFKGIGD